MVGCCGRFGTDSFFSRTVGNKITILRSVKSKENADFSSSIYQFCLLSDHRHGKQVAEATIIRTAGTMMRSFQIGHFCSSVSYRYYIEFIISVGYKRSSLSKILVILSVPIV